MSAAVRSGCQYNDNNNVLFTLRDAKLGVLTADAAFAIAITATTNC